MLTYGFVASLLGHHGLPVKTLPFEGGGFVAFLRLLHHKDTIPCRTTNKINPLAKTTTTTNMFT